jgi:hypothetical protein
MGAWHQLTFPRSGLGEIVGFRYIGRMARPARLTVPGLPHHVTHRGNRKQRTFFSERD